MRLYGFVCVVCFGIQDEIMNRDDSNIVRICLPVPIRVHHT